MSVFKQVAFNDGEGIDYADLQLAQQFIVASLWETLLGRMGEGVVPDPLHTGVWYGRAGVAVPAGAARQIQLFGGLLALAAKTSDSFHPTPVGGNTASVVDESKIVPYWLPDSSVFVTHAVGHATLPRYDTVVATLEWVENGPETRDFKDAVTGALSSEAMSKRRTAVLTTAIVQGIPAASPELPEIPTDFRYVPIYSVLVPAAHNAVFTLDQIIDHRYPAGGGIAEVYAVDAWQRGAYTGTWTRQTGGAFGAMSAGAGGDTMLFAPVLPPGSRVVAVEVVGGDVSGSSTVVHYRATGSGYGSVAGGTVESAPFSVGVAAAGSVVTTLVGGVLWASGYKNTRPGSASGNASLTRAAVRFTAGGANDRVTLVRFYYRGGVF